MVSMSRAGLAARSFERLSLRFARPRETSEQYEASITELARRLLPGTAFHVAGFVFVELRMPRADQLPHTLIVTAFLCLMVARLVGVALGLTRRGPVAWRLGTMAAGSIGANVVWGVR